MNVTAFDPHKSCELGRLITHFTDKETESERGSSAKVRQLVRGQAGFQDMLSGSRGPPFPTAPATRGRQGGGTPLLRPYFHNFWGIAAVEEGPGRKWGSLCGFCQ